MASSEPATSPLTALFDEEAARARPSLTGYAEPARAQATVHRVLDAVGRRVADRVGLLAVDVARSALGVVDAFTVQELPPPPAAPRRAPLGAGLRSILGFEEAPPAPRVMVDVDRLFAAARDALGTAERMREAATPSEPVAAVRPWAEDAQLLALFQDLFAGARRRMPEFLHACIAQLGDDLVLEHGIDVVEFDGVNRILFEVVPAHIGPRRTLRPALVHKGELLRPGEAAEPVDIC